jgi:hypothetical protein
LFVLILGLEREMRAQNFEILSPKGTSSTNSNSDWEYKSFVKKLHCRIILMALKFSNKESRNGKNTSRILPIQLVCIMWKVSTRKTSASDFLNLIALGYLPYNYDLESFNFLSSSNRLIGLSLQMHYFSLCGFVRNFISPDSCNWFSGIWASWKGTDPWLIFSAFSCSSMIF